TVLMAVARELSDAERIRREQAVGPGVPVGRRAQVPGMVEDGDADVLVLDAAVIVHPLGPFAPDQFFAAGAVRVDALARRLVERLHDADGERAFFGVAHRDWTVVGVNRELAVDGSGYLVASKLTGLALFSDDARRANEIERRAKMPHLGAA